eukprot:TRINITY_DN3670_c0_g1_i3.p1 TRINITY_DN3670_c0_g1~~TRINITY_DN3670_c0_g1_i3.p1  ORF type:complete len:240 (+),score=46.79 TRINITY_DN3670_c0_g1_i3:59-778(+)
MDSSGLTSGGAPPREPCEWCRELTKVLRERDTELAAKTAAEAYLATRVAELEQQLQLQQQQGRGARDPSAPHHGIAQQGAGSGNGSSTDYGAEGQRARAEAAEAQVERLVEELGRTREQLQAETHRAAYLSVDLKSARKDTARLLEMQLQCDELREELRAAEDHIAALSQSDLPLSPPSSYGTTTRLHSVAGYPPPPPRHPQLLLPQHHHHHPRLLPPPLGRGAAGGGGAATRWRRGGG